MENAHNWQRFPQIRSRLGILPLAICIDLSLGPKPKKCAAIFGFQDPDGQMVKLAARKDPITSYVLGRYLLPMKLGPISC